MKQEIIKQMTQVVADVMTSFQSDFHKYDMELLENYDERFLWFVAPSHMHLARIGENYLNEIVNTEEELYAVVKRNMTADVCLAIDNSKELVFYYDGNKLEKVTRMEAKRLWEAIRSWLLHNWQIQNGMCAIPSDFTIPIKFNCSLSYLKEQLRYAKEIGTTTLMDAFKRFRTYNKINSTHKCEIGRDFADRSFTFAFSYNDSKTGEEKYSLCGGLIFYDGKWNVHT